MDSNIKLLTFETGREEKLQMNYWLKERRRIVRRCSRILNEMHKDINRHFKYVFGTSELYIAMSELNETQREIEQLEWIKSKRENEHFIFNKCTVNHCVNMRGEGLFIGSFCFPCWDYLTEGQGETSQAYRNDRLEYIYIGVDHAK